MTHRIFRRPQTIREYGYVDGRLAEQEDSPSGFLLGWDAIDDQAVSIATGRPPMYVVIGEYEVDGIKSPELAVSETYMSWAGYSRDGRTWRANGAA